MKTFIEELAEVNKNTAERLSGEWLLNQTTVDAWSSSGAMESNDLKTEIKDDFLIGVGKVVSNRPIFDHKLQRYFLYVYSFGQAKLLYFDSNIIDATHVFTFDEVVEKCQKYFSYTLKDLNKISGH